MFNHASNAIDRLPHSTTQLGRGFIGLFVGGFVAILMAAIVTVLQAPWWFEGALGTLGVIGALVAIGVPGWFWIVEPFWNPWNGDEEEAED